jgi:hypothetical protein
MKVVNVNFNRPVCGKVQYKVNFMTIDDLIEILTGNVAVYTSKSFEIVTIEYEDGSQVELVKAEKNTDVTDCYQGA